MDQQNKQQKQEQELQQLKSIFKKNDPQNHIQPLSQILKKFIPQFRKTFGQSSQNPQNPPDHPQDLQKQQKFLQFITSCKLLEKPKGEFLYHFQEKIKHVYIILQGQVAIWEQKEDPDLTKELELNQKLKNFTQKLKESKAQPDKDYFQQQIEETQHQLSHFKDEEQENLLKLSQNHKKYFILQSTTNQKIQRTLTPGDTIGESNALSKLSAQNGFQIKKSALLLQISQKNYLQIFDYQLEKIEFIQKSLKIYFPRAHPDTIKRLSFFFEENHFPLNHFIYKNEPKTQKLFLIRSGTVKISQKINYNNLESSQTHHHNLNQSQNLSPLRKKKKIDVIDLQEKNIFGYETSQNFTAQVTSYPSALVYSIKFKQIHKIILKLNDIFFTKDLKILQQKKHQVLSEFYQNQHDFNLQQQQKYLQDHQEKQQQQLLQQQKQSQNENENIIQQRKEQYLHKHRKSRKLFPSQERKSSCNIIEKTIKKSQSQHDITLQSQDTQEKPVKKLNWLQKIHQNSTKNSCYFNNLIEKASQKQIPETQRKLSEKLISTRSETPQKKHKKSHSSNLQNPQNAQNSAYFYQFYQQNQPQQSPLRKRRQSSLKSESKIYESFSEQKSQLYDKLFQETNQKLVVMEQNHLEKIKNNVIIHQNSSNNNNNLKSVSSLKNNIYLKTITQKFQKSQKRLKQKQNYLLNSNISYNLSNQSNIVKYNQTSKQSFTNNTIQNCLNAQNSDKKYTISPSKTRQNTDFSTSILQQKSEYSQKSSEFKPKTSMHTSLENNKSKCAQIHTLKQPTLLERKGNSQGKQFQGSLLVGNRNLSPVKNSTQILVKIKQHIENKV